MAPGTMSWGAVGRDPSLSTPHGSRPNSFTALQYLYFIQRISTNHTPYTSALVSTKRLFAGHQP